MKILSAIFVLFLSLPASAALIWENATGFSNRLQWLINNNANVVILGGMGGPACVGDNVGTCNSCTSTLTEVCNTVRIYPTLNFTVFFSSTDKVGTPRITAVNPNGVTDIQLNPAPIPSIPVTLTPTQVSVTTTWGSLCNAFQSEGANPNCTFRGSQLFKIGIDSGSDGNLDGEDDFITFTLVVEDPTNFDNASTQNKGLVDYSLFPGDQKAYIENVRILPANRPIAKVHFYSVGGDGADYSQITASDTTVSIAVNNGSMVKDTIDGLPNGEQRFFSARSEDDAGNIGLLLNLGDSPCPRELIPDANGVGRCRAVTPSAVGGLFKDNCFIATAAYGSKFEPHVATLRLFRDRYLLSNTIGKSFVRLYYKISPAIADWIAASESRRTITRWALTPVVLSTGAFMAAPMTFLIAFSALFLLFVAFSVRRLKTQTARSRG